jgi:hypothetical protein
MEEKNYFSDRNITITSTRVIVSGTTYSLRNISSVKMTTVEPSHIFDIICIIIGVLSLIGGVSTLNHSGGICVVLGILIGIVGFFIYKSKKSMYYVVLGTNSGEQKAYFSTDVNYIQNIVNEINNAIIDYR